MMDWISVKDRLPSFPDAFDCELRQVICYDGKNVFACFWNIDLNAFDEAEVTHWQPLPEPPKS